MGIETLEDLEKTTNREVETEVETQETNNVVHEEQKKEEPATGGEQQNTEQQEVAKYVPNYKYRVLEKDYEIPENFRSLIKDANSEKEIREMFEKLQGFDSVKSARDRIKTDYEGVNKQLREVTHKYEEHDKIINHVSECLELVHKGDVLEGLSLLVGNNEQLMGKIFEGIINYHQADELGKSNIINKYTNNLNQYQNNKQREYQENQNKQKTSQYEEIVRDYSYTKIDSIINNDVEAQYLAKVAQERTGDKDFFKKYIEKIRETEYPDIRTADYASIISSAKDIVKQTFGIQGSNQMPGKQENFSSSTNGQVNPKINETIKKKEVAIVPPMNGGNNGMINKGKMTSIEEVQKYYGID